MRKQKGFSLIELLIVVAIILIIAAIAIPNLMRARIAANESSAAASIRTINTGEVTYQSNYGVYATLAQLGGAPAVCAAPVAANACLIDNFLAQNGNPANSGKSGYSFTAAQGGGAVAAQSYIATGTRLSTSSGNRGFCATEDGVVRVDPAGAAAQAYAGCLALNALN
jgi:prepilin-type N-terminal cleavage/methylation domain-containing protein